MAGFLNQFRQKVEALVKEQSDSLEEVEAPFQEISQERQGLDDKIALGVLLWIVAEADNKFLPEEEKKIKEILTQHGRISKKDMPYILGAIHQAAKERVDLYSFTREVSLDLSYQEKIPIIENLFRIACSDNDLEHNEIEIIRKISGLFGVDHKDFIESKIKIKKEFGLDK